MFRLYFVNLGYGSAEFHYFENVLSAAKKANTDARVEKKVNNEWQIVGLWNPTRGLEKYGKI